MIPFNRPYLTGNELAYISDAHHRGQLAGDGFYTHQCNNWLEQNHDSLKALLTHSCTAALEMAAILANVQPGDEIIMPSYTFVSTANAFVLRGGVPVFIDIRSDTLNIDETLIESAITAKTKVIVVVHYAGNACEMDFIMDIARRHSLLVIEDAAQAILASYKGKKLGSIGHLGCLSFHETKNVTSGEGGALLINCPDLVERAEIIWNKGTNRSQFNKGKIDKYSWIDIGSSFLPSEMTAAFLWAQLQHASEITKRRLDIWRTYHDAFLIFEKDLLLLRRPKIIDNNNHNAHMYFLLLNSQDERNRLIKGLQLNGVHAVTHYVPLHSSSAGLRYGRAHGSLKTTDLVSSSLVRLPFWIGLENKNQKIIIDMIHMLLNAACKV